MSYTGGLTGILTGLLFCILPALSAQADESLVGTPINQTVSVVLDEDIGFGKTYRLSLKNNFQDWGAQKVTAQDGHPVRLGNKSLRIETREGECGWDGKTWNDCRNGRHRHELSTAVYGFDEWNREYWYAISVFIPADYSVPRNVGNSMFQFLARGKPNWLIKFDDTEGLFIQREFDFQRARVVASYAAKKKWHDFVIRITHSTGQKGRFTVWRNGRQVYDHTGPTARKTPSKHRPYFKFGIYNTGLGKDGAPVDGKGFRNGKGLPGLVLYYDEIRAAQSCEKLKLDELGYSCSEMMQ
ncbi:heparin lyase I family protein [Hoeflea prorocentri]|uniref:Heparin lyase I family protein n=1 Tax=Hoeflea prorocentri TaxID=1922333 RepID=A0A9X3ZG33_9HYPH|nr:heparin lyase I family protein [Hoeflea prorocentri]MCY6380337.1 heparin lyase I family protein [Hoeflea prorocentri]MDA5398137.1 heparin lyase I family protein [Hoeflea prorocentri]